MKTISHHIENLSQHSHMITSVELVGNLHVFVYICQDLLQQLQPQIGISAEFMSKGPHHAVKNCVEIVFVKGK